MKTQSRDVLRSGRWPRAMMLLAGTAVGLSAAAPALAAPEGARVVRGDASITRGGAETTIRAADGTIIEYRSFDIGGHESVRFLQPHERARVLNRIDGAAPTRIDGAIYANGRVYIVNPSGVIFGPGSVIDAAGIFAAAGDITNSDFLAGNNLFTNVTGPVTAQGLITADAVHLIGSRVANHGTIVADGGVVSMLVGERVLVKERGSVVSARIENPSGRRGRGVDRSSAVIENTGSVSAAGGSISLGAGDAVSLAIRGEGALNAPGGTVAASAGDLDIDAAAVSGAGDFAAGASNDIFIIENITKADGGISLDAGRDVVFTTPPGTFDLTVEASFIELTAGRSIRDAALLGTSLVSTSGDIALTASGGSVDVASLETLTPGSNISWTQRDSLFLRLSGPNGVLATPGTENVAVTLTGAGSVLTFGGDFGGLGPGATVQEASSLDATAPTVRLWDSLDIAGGATLLATSGDVIFGTPTDPGFLAGPATNLTIQAANLDIRAAQNLTDNVLLGASLVATTGDVFTLASTGRVDFGSATVPSGNTVSITQALSRFIDTSNSGLLTNPNGTNLVVDVTAGSLTIGGDFGGLADDEQFVLSLDARAARDLMVDDSLTAQSFASLRAGDEALVGNDVIAGSALLVQGGSDGSGAVRFTAGGLTLAGSTIELIGGNGASAGGSGAVVATVNTPSLLGSGGAAGTSPASFTLRQDAAIGAGDLPIGSAFGGGTAGVEYLAQSHESDVTLADNGRVAGSSLTLASSSSAGGGGRTFIDGALDLLDLTVLGDATLAAGVDTQSFQLYDGDTVLAQTVGLVAGTSVTFDGLVDASSPGGQGLSTDTLGNTTVFNGRVGGVAPLAFLNVAGTATINNTLDGQDALVRTVGDQTWGGALDILKDAAIETTADSTVRFGSTLDGPFDLTLSTQAGLVEFVGAVGGTDRLGELLITSNRLATPDAATIVGEGDTLVRAQRFEMAPLEKFTALGDLEIDATTRALVGDLVAAGSMTVRAPEIVLLLRPAGDLLDEDGDVLADAGLDFVARDLITFDGTVILGGAPGAPGPLFGNTFGSGSVSTTAGSFAVLDVPPADVSEPGLRLFGAGRVLDQRVLLPATAAEATLIDQRPIDPEFEDSVIVRPFDLGLLADLGVSPTLPVADGRNEVDPTAARNLYFDTPLTLDADPAGVGVAASRFDIETVAAVNALSARVLGDPATSAAIRGSVDQYMTMTGAEAFDARGYVRYVRSTPTQAEAASAARRVGLVLASLREMGLNRREYESARAELLSGMADGLPGVTPGALASAMELALVESDPSLDGTDRVVRID